MLQDILALTSNYFMVAQVTLSRVKRTEEKKSFELQSVHMAQISFAKDNCKHCSHDVAVDLGQTVFSGCLTATG